jgi:CubicO group peptidase (beta-lactamase class C family)
MSAELEEIVIEGDCDPRFARVREAFAEGFRSRDEVGAAVSVFLGGEAVVELWAGFADQAKTRPWQRDTLVNVYSTTKGMTALCAHRLVEEGKLDLDAPVARYWPEFAAGGKAEMPVRYLLGHRSGLPAVRRLLPGEFLYDWDAITGALAAEEPWWKPGEQHGYHAVTFGWLVGEVVRRITGRSLGTYFREEIAEPLGADFWIGLPDHEHARVGEMSAIPLQAPPGEDGMSLAMTFMKDPEGMTARAFMNPPSMAKGPNHAEWRRAEIPGANGHATARALASIYGAVASDGASATARVIGGESVERCREEQSRGRDAVLQIKTRFGLGFMLPQGRPGTDFGPNPGAFGHPGAGGSVGFADPERGIGFGYVMNRMGPHILLDPRATALIDAVYACL